MSQEPGAAQGPIVAGVILAAGSAVRMGEPKQLLAYRGRPLLQHVIDTAEQSALSAVVVVTGAHAELVTDGVRLGRAITAHNERHHSGNMTSLETGAAALPSADALVVLMGDQPEVDGRLVDQMVDLWGREQPWGAVVSYRDRIGHPFLLSATALAEAIATPAPKRLWSLLAGDDTHRVRHLPTDQRAPLDVNTPEDLERLRQAP